jgi:ribosomal protein S18 acetylase RimI-like enzyme
MIQSVFETLIRCLQTIALLDNTLGFLVGGDKRQHSEEIAGQAGGQMLARVGVVWMDIREYRRSDLHNVFEYWKKVGTDIPYFFPVSAQRWQTCLLEDELDGERIFDSLETYLATESGQVLGFVQCGQPNYAWDEIGQKRPHPHIGVIRHLYFEKGRSDVGEALLAKAGDHLARFDQNYAFFHILGMSCNAHHGKLHISQTHVDQLLRAYGFRIEHENVYYVLDMNRTAPVENIELTFCSTPGSGKERFEVQLDTEVVGTAGVRYLDMLTDGHTSDTVYLTKIRVAEQYRSQGIGTAFLTLVAQSLLSRGYRYLHTDAASSNVRAQQFYRKLGFQKEGYTRSYVQA